jgi:colicin import membrane protein
MISDVTYKVSFVFALILHVALVIFLFVKFTHSKTQVGLVASNNIIKAVAINERDFDNQISKKVVTKESLTKKEMAPQNAAKRQEKPSVASNLQDLLKKNLLKEQERELAELKKEKQNYKKSIEQQEEQGLQKMSQEQVSAEQKLEHGSRLAGEVDKYKTLIKQAIYLQWINPEGTGVGDFCRLRINIAPGGLVLDVKLIASSGNVVLDRSAQAAIFKASPLPVPDDIKLFDEVRTIDFTFRPEGIVGN